VFLCQLIGQIKQVIRLQIVDTTEPDSVSEGELPFPTPQIPSLGISGAIFLATALAWIANKALRRTQHSRAA